MKIWIVLGLLALLVRPVLAQLGGCPNTMATTVAASSDSSGPSTTCQLGIVLFGIPIGIDAVSCPNKIYIYPAHKACLGAGSPGHYCGAGASAPVHLHRCACALIGTSMLGISLPVCRCHHAGIAGTIPTGETFPCIDS